jgi:hypothetical protein
MLAINVTAETAREGLRIYEVPMPYVGRDLGGRQEN